MSPNTFRTDALIRLLVVVALLSAAADPQILRADEEQPIAAEEVQLGRPVEFERDIYPILEANCIACHNLALAENELILENVAAIMKGGSAGPSIVAGKPDESLLFQVAARIEEPVMPPWPNDVQAKKLTPRQVGLLRQWILEGAVGGGSGKSAVMNWMPIHEQLQAVYAVDIDLSGRFVAAGRGGLVSIYDLAVPGRVSQLVDPELNAPAVANEPIANVRPATHRDYVHALAFHPSGQMIATSGYREVKLWKRQLDAVAGRMALDADVQQVACSPNGAVAFAGATPGVTLTQAGGSDQRLQIDTSGQTVTALQFVPSDPLLLVIGLADGRIQVVNAVNGEVRHLSEPLTSPVAAFASPLSERRLAALSADGVVRLLQIDGESAESKLAGEIRSEAGPIRMVAANGAKILTLTGDQKAEVWKAEDAARMSGADLPGAVADAAIHDTSDRVVFVLQDGQSLLWSFGEPKQIAALNQDLHSLRQVKDAERQKALRESRSAVLKTRIEEAEKELTAQKEAETKAKAELDQSVTAAAEAKKKLEEAVAATAAARKALEAAPEDEAAKKAVEPAEKAEAAAKEASTAADSKQQLAQKGFEFAAAAVTRADQRVADRKQQQLVAQQEAEVAATALETSQSAAAATSVQSGSACIVEDGSVVVTVDNVGGVRIWKALDGTPLDILPSIADTGEVRSVSTTGSTLRTITAAEVVSRELLPQWQLDTVLGATSDEPESVFVDRVLALAFSPDGNLLAAGGGEASRQGQLTLWSIPDQSLVRQFPDAHSDTVYGVEFSPDGKLLATASADKFAKVFNVETGKHVQSFEGHTHHVMDVSWKADLTLLASAGADNAIKVWNAETGEQSRTISVYSKQVTSLTFVGLQDNILSSSGDRRVFLHKAGDGKPVREFGGSPDYVYGAAATPDGGLIVAGGEDGILRVWNGTDGKEIVSFKP